MSLRSLSLSFSPISSPLSNVSLHVQTEMVASGESPFAEMALERSVSGVFAVVTGKFVRSREFPPASFPIAMVRLLARVSPQVRLQMRRLGVCFSASGMRASVRCRPLSAPSASSAFLRRRSAADVDAAKAEKRASGAAEATEARATEARAHGQKEIGELRRGWRSHERMMRMRRKVRMRSRVMMSIHEISRIRTGCRVHREGLWLMMLLLKVMLLLLHARVDHAHGTSVVVDEVEKGSVRR